MTEIQKKNNFFNQKRYSVIIIFFVVLAVYINTLNNQFTNWDDVALIINNEQIRSLDLKNIKTIFDFRPQGTYQPVRVLSYAIDYHFWKFNPVGYHIHNILLHAFASIFLYLGLLRIIPGIRGMEQAEYTIVQYAAFFTALVFAVHPLSVEAVTWLSGRKYVLLSFFSFFSLYLFAKSFKAGTGQFCLISGSVFLAFLAALSSPFGVVFPLIVFIYIYSMDESNNPVCALNNHKAVWMPYCVIFVPVFLKLWTALVKINPGGTGPGTGHFEGNSLYTLWTMLRALFDYVRNIFFPFWLNIRYPDFVSTSFMEYKIITVITIIAVMAVIILWNLKKGDKRLFFCIAWFIIFWLPVSNIIPISTKMADRYIYMAFPGVVLLFSLYAFQLFNVIAKKLHISGVIVSLIAVLLVVCYLGQFTIRRNLFWKDSGTLWTESLRMFQDNAIAHNNLGVHLLYFKKEYQKAEHHFTEALRLKPESLQPYQNLYDTFLMQGLYGRAVACGKTVIQRFTSNADWHYKTGFALAEMKKHEEAIHYYQKAIYLDADFTEALYYSGVSFSELGDEKKAEEYYRKVLKIDSVHVAAINNLGTLLIKKKNFDEAQVLFEKAINSGKNDVNIYFNLGIVFSLKQKPEKAVKCFLKVIDLNPEDAVANFLAGKELLKLGGKKDGKRYIQTARQLDPDNSNFY
jgi:protein O-mannosyl-transferase